MVGEEGESVESFDAVVLAVPFSVLKDVDHSGAGFDELKRTAIAQLGCGDNAKLHLQFQSRFWHNRGPWPGWSNGNIYTDLPLQNTWDASRWGRKEQPA